MSASYAPLPNFPSAPDAERELDDAFESGEDERVNESIPLIRPDPISSIEIRSSVPGAYDFEREYDYDYPPPGSPPRPTSYALPNDIGNSNGRLPSSPVPMHAPRLSFFRRTVGAILPTHYMQVQADSSTMRHRGGGIENDGVFANVMAKPQKASVVRTEDGEVIMLPEDAQKDIPPSYADAQLDSVPPYWETTVHAPSGFHSGSDMIIDDLPSGSLWTFALTLVTSYFFQFVGFLLTYLLHTSHAGMYGSRAGLGLTLIQYGFYSRTAQSGVVQTSGELEPPFQTSDPSSVQSMPAQSGSMSSREWISFFLMTLGWFLLLTSAVGFWRVKRWERSIRSTDTGPMATEDVDRDIIARRNIESVFGISDHGREEGTWVAVQRNEHGDDILIPDSTTLEDARLTRHLAAAGLL